MHEHMQTDIPRKRILVVDDEPSIADSLRLLLKTTYEVDVAGSGIQALEIIDHAQPDLILLDVMMPKMDGLETLRQVKERTPQLPVVMLTAASTVKTAVEAMKCGAVDYLNKPFDFEELSILIKNTLELAEAKAKALAELEAKNDNGGSRAMLAPPADFGSMVGQSSAMTNVFDIIKQVAEKDTTVLITGESGTGKELVARRIHELSGRNKGPFVALNCAAIPESLIESELFGHERGAFTHAVDRRLGHFELADGGTLFLDEIGELSLAVQVKMLRFLQDQEFFRVGRSKAIRVNVRIIAATNKNLEDLIIDKKFRQDLYYRINVINVCMPALRDRFEDIPNLISHFVQKFSPLYGRRKLELTSDAMMTLVEYHWPGNVRELENVMESLMALAKNDSVCAEDLPKKLKVRNGEANGMRAAIPAEGMKFEDAERLFETEMILKALKKTNYVQTRAAELLGISRRILKYKMDKLGIKEEPPVGGTGEGVEEE